jgi:hypothetical protein
MNNSGTLSWFLFNFVLWHRQWIEERVSDPRVRSDDPVGSEGRTVRPT